MSYVYRGNSIYRQKTLHKKIVIIVVMSAAACYKRCEPKVEFNPVVFYCFLGPLLNKTTTNYVPMSPASVGGAGERIVKKRYGIPAVREQKQTWTNQHRDRTMRNWSDRKNWRQHKVHPMHQTAQYDGGHARQSHGRRYLAVCIIRTCEPCLADSCSNGVPNA